MVARLGAAQVKFVLMWSDHSHFSARPQCLRQLGRRIIYNHELAAGAPIASSTNNKVNKRS